MNGLVRYICILAFLFSAKSAFSQYIDLSKAQVYTNITDRNVLLRSLEILQEEISKRSGINLVTAKKMPKSTQPLIIIALENNLSQLSEEQRKVVNNLKPIHSEGFKLLSLPSQKSVLIVAKDARGLLYGIGRLLRKLDISSGKILISDQIALSTSPKYPIRGHQLGYRPKTNAYDAFSVEQFDQYIRDLALFGANHIEILPPHTDDDFSSPHMKLPAIKMIVEQSRICKEYGLDVSIWYPNIGKNYTHPDSIRKELKDREEVFSILPKLNAVFVPGGDPGDLEPDVLFPFLEKEAEILKKYHPNAKIWVSPQAMKPSQKFFDQFFEHANREYPWFAGVVFGPWVAMPVQEIRAKLKPSILIRQYPDITHNYSSQYPVPHWDLAYALTLGRESINPRPVDQKAIHNALDEFAIGSISYSEGTNDDVNKFVWSDQDWDPTTPVMETLRDYARLFMNGVDTESVALGLLSLERNWKGELLTNEGVNRTLGQWQHIEKSAPLKVRQNPRFQMGLIRAYYDAYIRERLIYETDLEAKAKRILQETSADKSILALNEATAVLKKGWKEPILKEYQQKCNDLADSLFKSIGAQLTMKKHGAMSDRGNFMDYINQPLNDAPWLLHQFDRIQKIDSPDQRLTEIQKILNRTDPGPGGFYDHLGGPESWYRIVSETPAMADPGSLRSPRIGFTIGLTDKQWKDTLEATGLKGFIAPKAWMKQAKTLYSHPLKVHYDNLDTSASYKIRIAYTGRFRARVKLTTEDESLIHDYVKIGEQPIYEFDIPKNATKSGSVTFVWTAAEGERGSQVAEIWIIKQ